jgi:hypothetical protein
MWLSLLEELHVGIKHRSSRDQHHIEGCAAKAFSLLVEERVYGAAGGGDGIEEHRRCRCCSFATTNSYFVFLESRRIETMLQYKESNTCQNLYTNILTDPPIDAGCSPRCPVGWNWKPRAMQRCCNETWVSRMRRNSQSRSQVRWEISHVGLKRLVHPTLWAGPMIRNGEFDLVVTVWLLDVFTTYTIALESCATEDRAPLCRD